MARPVSFGAVQETRERACAILGAVVALVALALAWALAWREKRQ